MLRFTVVVVLETLGFLALAPKKAMAQFGGAHDSILIDPADGSAYVARSEQGLSAGTLAGRWQVDGAFDRMNGPFAPVPALQKLMPFIYAGHMTFVADGETVYQHDQSGAWLGTAWNRMPGDPLGCGSSTTGRCNLGAPISYGNDEEVLLVVTPTGVQFRYPTPTGYRGPEGVESKLDFSSFIFLSAYGSEFIWSSDRQQMLGMNTNFGSGLSYNSYTLAGLETRVVSHTKPLVQVPLGILITMGDTVYMVVTDFLSASGSDGKAIVPQIFLVEAPFSKNPRGVQILKDDQYSTGMQFGIAHEGEYIYLRRGHGQDAQLTAFHAKSKDLVDLAACPGSGSSPVTLIASKRGSKAYWLACGREVYGLHDGRVVQHYTATGRVTGGTALPAAGGEGDEVAVAELGGSLERFNPDGSRQYVGADGTGSIVRPSLRVFWETAMGQVCGVAEDAPAVIGCDHGSVWQTGGYAMPAPYAVWHTPDAEWALSLAGADTIVYRRPIAAPESAWRKVQAFATEAPPPFDKRMARFIAQGPTQVAVQDAAGQYWRWDGRGFTQSYPHPFIPSTLQPVIGEDGYLYDACPVQAGAEVSLVCAFTSDGARHSLEGREGISVRAQLAPLKRGVLAQEGPDPVVLRGTRMIGLGKLHGEFARGKNEYYAARGPALGDGSVLLSSPRDGKVFRYDGHKVTLFQNEGVDADRRSNSEMAGGSQIWLGHDGIWRLSRQSDGRGLIYAKNPLLLTQAAGVGKTGSQVLAAASFHGQTWLATPHGLWTCAQGEGTLVSVGTSSLPVSKGCKQRWSLPYVTKLKSTSSSLVMQQGNRVLELIPGANPAGTEDRIEVLSAGDTSAQALGHAVTSGVDVVSFVEGDHVLLRSGQPAVKLELPLPAGVTSAQVRATGERWLCTEEGLFWLDPAQAWQAAAGGEACVGLATAGGQALALSQTEARLCRQGVCAEPVGLPKAYLEDTAVGTLDASAAAFGLVMGRNLYRFSPAGFVDVTPTYAKGSALLTAASDLNNGFVSLRLGGVLALGQNPAVAPAWRHLRLQ